MSKLTLVIDFEDKQPNLEKLNFYGEFNGGKLIGMKCGTIEDDLIRIITKNFGKLPADDDMIGLEYADHAKDCVQDIIMNYDLDN